MMETLTREEGEMAVSLARATLERTIGGKEAKAPTLTPVFAKKRGVFVTLTKAGQLRGCIGFPYPMIPLGEAIREVALSAAQQDPRFPPVQARELSSVTVEVTVLTPPERIDVSPLERPAEVEVGRHGLIVNGYGRSGLLLPQVAPEYSWDAREFLDHTCMKAGLSAGCWKEREIEVFRFEGQIFHE